MSVILSLNILLLYYYIYNTLTVASDTVLFLPFCIKATIKKYPSESVRAPVCVGLCVVLHNNSQSIQSRYMKFEYILIYENRSAKLDFGHFLIKIKTTVGFQSFLLYRNTHNHVMKPN